ncbi:hypothetical protein [Tabrizicola sp.]|uniref:hypothetical protein n=1 Tax=Tabrizicola sp. TaxID=2005166 RepID=UPI002FDDE2AD
MTGVYWSLGGMLAALIAGYTVGWQHGHDKASLAVRAATQVVVEPYPFANVCSEMLEAAWSVQPAPSPHD